MEGIARIPDIMYAACICGGWVIRIFMALVFYNLRTSAWRCIFDKLKIKATM